MSPYTDCIVSHKAEAAECAPAYREGNRHQPDGLPALVELVWQAHVQVKPQFRISLSQTAQLACALASPDLKTVIVDCALAGLFSAAEAEYLIDVFGLTHA
jgi:hypothetical protein